jgi:hypothetical protein
MFANRDGGDYLPLRGIDDGHGVGLRLLGEKVRSSAVNVPH